MYIYNIYIPKDLISVHPIVGKGLKPSILLYGGVWIQMVCPVSISFHHGTYQWFDGFCRICYKGLVVLEKVLKMS